MKKSKNNKIAAKRARNDGAGDRIAAPRNSRARRNDKRAALVAGALRLPFLVRDDLIRQGYEVFVIGIKNFCDPALKPDMWTRLGAMGAPIKELRRRGIPRVVFAGAIGHPNLSDIIPDAAAIKILARVAKHQDGYDSMGATFIAEIEKLGFSVIAGQDLCPALTFKKGVQTKTKPSKNDAADIARAIEVSKTIGRMDIGQSAVVHKQVLCVEAAEGTARMLERAAVLNRKRGGVLAKMAKPSQDLRIDIPAIGIDTVRACLDAKLAGIVVDAKKCWAIDTADLIALADRNKFFIVAE